MDTIKVKARMVKRSSIGNDIQTILDFDEDLLYGFIINFTLKIMKEAIDAIDV
jgi:hypothetical protein